MTPSSFSEISSRQETLGEKNTRFASGQISEEEIQEYWQNPENSLFEHELFKQASNGQESHVRFQAKALTEDLIEPLLAEGESAWDGVDLAGMKESFQALLDQRKSNVPPLLKVEYYILTDENNHPFAVTGIYSIDINGGAGLTTRNELDPQAHNLITGVGWYSVSKKYQGKGIGGFLFDWTENVARSRGVKIMCIDTDDWENEEVARGLYERRGYKRGFNVPNYFGPNRDLFTYFDNIADKKVEPLAVEGEQITAENQKEILEIAKSIYPPERYQEFEKSLNLIFNQPSDANNLFQVQSFVARGNNGKIESFCVYEESIYKNTIFVPWYGVGQNIEGSKDRLLNTLRSAAKKIGRDVIIISKEGSDSDLDSLGFQAADQGIPEVYGKGDPTQYLFYTKHLSEENIPEQKT